MEGEAPEHLPPAELATRLRWDVFLSFRGEDTRHKFTVPLYDALQANAVRAFLDNEGMNRGDEIAPTLIEAIEDSAAAVAVISKRYADSHWCLEELSRIVECRLLILPVFYKVDPSDVLHQRGPFAAAFESHQRRFDERKVAKWREALKEVGNRAGFVFVQSEESRLMQKIVKRVLAEINSKPMHFPTYAVGLESRVERALRMLDVQSNGVRVLGIHGTPGIGKTTLAKATFNKLVGYFENRSFISNVKEMCVKEGVLSVHRRIYSDLTKQPESDINAETGTEIKNILYERRVIVVLDDVFDVDQLNRLGIKRRWFHEGSRIIITSRNSDVLLHFAHADELYEVKELNDSESLELFSYHSLKRRKPTEDFMDLLKHIVSLTGRLPLALEVFGSSLLDKRTTKEWEESLEKLKLIHPSHLQDVLKISFDSLDEQQKCLFLDISCLFIQMNMKLDYLTDVIEACGINEEAITDLAKKSLVKITSENTLWMHDQLRDMGRQIVMDENLEDPGRRSRLWDSNKIMTMLKDKMGTRSVRGIVMDFAQEKSKGVITAMQLAEHNFRRDPNISTTFIYLSEKWKECSPRRAENRESMVLHTECFKPLKKLELLQINHIKLKGNFNYMPAQLRWLQWKGCDRESVSDIPREIRVLDLSESKVKNLWGWRVCSWSNDKVAKHLTVINLSDCYSLTAIPDLSTNRNLKKLILERCVKLVNIHDSIGSMSSLTHMNLKECGNLIKFPRDVSGLKRLKELDLSSCSKLSKLPNDFRSLKALSRFVADRTTIAELPEYLFHLTQLELLSLNDCKQLKFLPDCIGQISSLKVLSLNGSAIERLPDSIGSLTRLEKLKLGHCKSLNSIPDSVGSLKALVEIFLYGSSIGQLPSSIGSLCYLKLLSVGGCPSLSCLPISIGGLVSVVELQLDMTPISELPDRISSLRFLKKLDMRKCTSLKSLPGSIGTLLGLTTLVIEDTAITMLPESIGMLENLRWLNVNNCKQLCRLPDSIGQLKSLLQLKMADTSVTQLPESFGMLSSLMVLNMARKPFLELPHANHATTTEQQKHVVLLTSLSRLCSLKELDARAFKITGLIPDDFQRLTSLEILNLGYNNFDYLPLSLQGLNVLKQLLLPRCEALKSLPPLPSSLLELNVADCYDLESVSDMSNLESLLELRLANCGKIVDVPGLECCKSLRRLYMCGCKSLASTVRRRLNKVALKNLSTLNLPGSQIPEWFSQQVVTFTPQGNLEIKGVLIGVIVSVQWDLLDDIRRQVPEIREIEARVLGLNKSVSTTVLDLTGMPRTPEDQLYLCRFKDYSPLVKLLRDGDKIEVAMKNEGVRGIELKRWGIYMVYENDDDYDGAEEFLDMNTVSLSERLARFFQSVNEEHTSVVGG